MKGFPKFGGKYIGLDKKRAIKRQNLWLATTEKGRAAKKRYEDSRRKLKQVNITMKTLPVEVL